MNVKDFFSRFAKGTSHAAGHPVAFLSAIVLLIAWAVVGPIFHFSDTWQLVINTGTTIITFLMVFLIQNTQNRDGEALQLKLDEIIRALDGARNERINVENLGEEDLSRLRKDYENLGQQAQQAKHSSPDKNQPSEKR